MATLMTPPVVPSLSQIAARTADTDADSANRTTDSTPSKIDVQDLGFFYGETQALNDISLTIPSHRVTAFIGPSGCGKSTFLRTLNRMNDIIPGTRVPSA